MSHNKGEKMKTSKYRLYPTKKQIIILDNTLRLCCDLYNAARDQRKGMWQSARKSIRFETQAGELLGLKKTMPEYKTVYAQVLQDVLRRVQKTFDNFYNKCKRGKKTSLPRWKPYQQYNTFVYPQVSNRAIRVENNKLNVPKIGHIKIKLYRPIEGEIKTCSITREGDKWYVCFVCEIKRSIGYHPSEEIVGIDLGLLHLATLSTGEVIDHPRYLRNSEHKLKKSQQKIAKKKKGSKQRKKAVKLLTKQHRKISNQRKDFLHKASKKLVEKYQTIVFEDLQIANLTKRPKPKQDEDGKYLPNGASKKSGLNKSIGDASWGTLVRLTSYKAESAGGRIIQVNPHNTSKMCSGCRNLKKELTLEERTYICENCGLVIDRDKNAAMNIKELWLGSSLQVSA